MNMNKREIKKEIKAAARKAGIRIGWRELDDIADMVIVVGGFHELSVELKEFGKLKQYIGTKLIQAAPALRIDDGDGNVRIELLDDVPITLPSDTVDMGYKVIYPDGYESWSPLDAFKAAYRPTDGMNFGLALEATKMGKKIARRGWNGKGMWVIYRTGCRERITCNKNTADAVGIPEGTLFKVRPYLQMKCVDDSFQMWLASQSDILADDWYIVE